jgi:hypothetical protein
MYCREFPNIQRYAFPSSRKLLMPSKTPRFIVQIATFFSSLCHVLPFRSYKHPDILSTSPASKQHIRKRNLIDVEKSKYELVNINRERRFLSEGRKTSFQQTIKYLRARMRRRHTKIGLLSMSLECALSSENKTHICYSVVTKPAC